ncbi:uncharacterized protein LOC112091969 [Morus notabilis]|uniref:uncharacterized protein LOC112091969 n=1 Tax=Morus notabilis TaxID=981085 RepID=UPI000CED55F2|nr:uncharacterized protein LOC112091969 [Morus notabilis]
MSNLAKLEFVVLDDMMGKNYLSWIIYVEMRIESMGLIGLKCKHLTVKDTLVLSKSLKERCDHQKAVILPATSDECDNLRFKDLKKVNDYNSAMFRIVSQLKFCGVNITDGEMLEKTYSTLHASHITLQQQYCLRGYKKFSELISAHLVTEKNNELLIKNHQSHPIGRATFLGASVAFSKSGTG